MKISYIFGMLVNMRTMNITVQFTAPEAKLSSDVANAFAKAYIEANLQLRTEPTREAAEWFEEQLKGLRAMVAQATPVLGMVPLDETVTVPPGWPALSPTMPLRLRLLLAKPYA